MLCLSPVFEEVFAKDVLGGVLVLQHLGEECGHLFSFGTQLHVLTWKCPGRTFCQFDAPSHSGSTTPQCVSRSQAPYRRSKTWRCWAEVHKEAQTRVLCVPKTSTWHRPCIALLPTLKPNQISLVISSGILPAQCIHDVPGEIERQQLPGRLTISTSPLAPSLLSFFHQQLLLFCFLRVLYPTKKKRQERDFALDLLKFKTHNCTLLWHAYLPWFSLLGFLVILSFYFLGFEFGAEKQH